MVYIYTSLFIRAPCFYYVHIYDALYKQSKDKKSIVELGFQSCRSLAVLKIKANPHENGPTKTFANTLYYQHTIIMP